MREGCYGSLRAEFEYQMQQWVAVLTRTPDGSQDHPGSVRVLASGTHFSDFTAPSRCCCLSQVAVCGM